MYVCITEVDAVTKVLCTVEPQRTGPSMPAVKGLQVQWWDQSTWPIAMDSNGTYLRAPKYYGTCDDDADITIVGVLEVLTEAEYTTRKRDEFYARQPHPSWTFDEATLVWSAPVTMPNDGKFYLWDEATTSWAIPCDGIVCGGYE
jgi:hypothetical protein